MRTKKIFLPAILTALVALIFSTTSCNDKICTRCTKISDPADVLEYCSSDEHKRNSFVVEQTHADYNCENFTK